MRLSVPVCACGVCVLSAGALFSFLFKWSTHKWSGNAFSSSSSSGSMSFHISIKVGDARRNLNCGRGNRMKRNASLGTACDGQVYCAWLWEAALKRAAPWSAGPTLPALPHPPRITLTARAALDTYRVSIMKWVTGALRGCWEWAQDKFTERDVKLINKGRSGGSGTSERDRQSENKRMRDSGEERKRQLSVKCKWKSWQEKGMCKRNETE